MNKRDRQQLRASIAKDLVQGQGEHSPTKQLLKQYAPLEGIITTPAPDISPRSGRATPVENSLAPHATVAPPATVERLATVKGELRVPNTVNFSLFPTLDPFAKAVYYQLFLLSHGFKRDTCIIGLAKLAKTVLMSQRKVQDTILYLEKRRLIKRVASILGGPSKGNIYQVLLPTTLAPEATVTSGAKGATPTTSYLPATAAQTPTLEPVATNKLNDDDENKKQ